MRLGDKRRRAITSSAIIGRCGKFSLLVAGEAYFALDSAEWGVIKLRCEENARCAN
jgi:hypothetical protein